MDHLSRLPKDEGHEGPQGNWSVSSLLTISALSSRTQKNRLLKHVLRNLLL